MIIACLTVFSTTIIASLATPFIGRQITSLLGKKNLELFFLNNNTQVPEYEVVKLRKVRKRDVEKHGHEMEIHLRAFGKDHQLRLKRNSELLKDGNLIKTFVADVKNGNVMLEDVTPMIYHKEMPIPFQDEGSGAAVVLIEDHNDNVQMEGIINGDIVITPVLDYWATGNDAINTIKTYDTKEEIDGNFSMSENRENLHIIFKRQSIDTDFSDSELLSGYVHVEFPTNGKRLKRMAIETLYPEILVFVDYETYLLHDMNERRITGYFTSFWNVVDLRYKTLSNPDIKLSLTAVVISKNPEFMPYVEDNRLSSPNHDALESSEALKGMAEYLYENQYSLPKFDLAILVTKLDMCRFDDNDSDCNRGTAGFAYVGGACHVDDVRKKINKAGIIEDSSGFSGIIIASHEVGHLLGAVHDGSGAPSYLKGPGAEDCNWEDGYIMSDLRHNVNGFNWSPCTKAQFRHFATRSTASCLFNKPTSGLDISGATLPGKIIPLNWQCRRDRGTNACFKDARVCTQLYCQDRHSGTCVAYRPAVEGTPCGSGKLCLNGLCVRDPNVSDSADYQSNFNQDNTSMG